MAQIQQRAENFDSYWHDSIMQQLQICQLYIHDVVPVLRLIPQGTLLDWDLVNELSEFIAAIWIWVQRGHKRMDMVSNNTWVDCGIYMMLSCYGGPKFGRKISPKPLNQ